MPSGLVDEDFLRKIEHYKTRVGPKLRAIREDQGAIKCGTSRACSATCMNSCMLRSRPVNETLLQSCGHQDVGEPHQARTSCVQGVLWSRAPGQAGGICGGAPCGATGQGALLQPGAPAWLPGVPHLPLLQVLAGSSASSDALHSSRALQRCKVAGVTICTES